MGRLLNVSSISMETGNSVPSLAGVLTDEILQVDRQLVEMQTSSDELSGLLLV